MTQTSQDFTDADLTVFRDGEADADLARQIERALAEDAVLAARMDRLDGAHAALVAGFDPARLDIPDMPDPISPDIIKHASAQWGLRQLAMPVALAASFALGMFVTTLTPPAAPGWIDQVASYQKLYVTQTLSGDAQDIVATQDTLRLAQIAFKGTSLVIPTIDGMEFKRAQMLAVDGAPLIQIAYLRADGTPFALCIKRVDQADRSVRITQSHALATASWVEGGLGYVFIGGDDRDYVNMRAERLTQTML
jgi:anti-sigma factor RsiW